MSFGKVFAGELQASIYKASRPSYPSALFKAVTRFAKQQGNRFDVAVDVACGSGQATKALVSHWNSVKGLDSSEAQISHAPALPNVTWKVGNAESLPFESSSVDLIFAAQAAHWFAWDTFIFESERVLRKGGVLAVVGYGMFHITKHHSQSLQKANQTLANYYKEMKPFFPGGIRDLVDRKYEDLVIPWENTRCHECSMEKEMPRGALALYLQSWSARNFVMEEHGMDPVERLRKDLAGLDPPFDIIDPCVIEHPLFLRMGAVPK